MAILIYSSSFFVDTLMILRQSEPAPPSRVVVVRIDRGWEVREQRDDTILRVIRHADWHRVERSVQLLERRDG